jgi:hypothetical protein
MYKHCRAADNSTAMINLRHNSPVPHYGCNGQPNQGIELPIIRVAKNILQKEKQMRDSGLISSSTRIHPGPADTNIFTDDGRSSAHASEMAQQGVQWVRADKSPGSRRMGAEKLRARLIASLKSPMEDPGIFIFDNCRDWIRCVPVLPRNPDDPDDVDSDAEDHNYDETRYRLLPKPYVVWRAY